MGFRVAVINARTGSDQQAITREYVAAAAAQDCALVCFPEGFLSLMPMGHPVFGAIDSPAVATMVGAAQAHGIHVLTGLWELDDNARYLSAVLATSRIRATIDVKCCTDVRSSQHSPTGVATLLPHRAPPGDRAACAVRGGGGP